MNRRTHYGDERTDKLVLQASEVQQLLDLSRASVYKALASGDIPSIGQGCNGWKEGGA